MKYTEEQKQRSLKKLAKEMAYFNSITSSAEEKSPWPMFQAAWKVLQKVGGRDEYFLEMKSYNKRKSK